MSIRSIGHPGRTPRVALVFWSALVIALILAAPGLYRRLNAEWANRTVALIVEYRDLTYLARESGKTPLALYPELISRGVCGVTAGEITGKELADKRLPLPYGPLYSLSESLRRGVEAPLDRAALFVPKSYLHADETLNYLSRKMIGTKFFESAGGTLAVLPLTPDELADSGLFPEYAAFDLARETGTAVIFRPAPAATASGRDVGLAVSWLKEEYPELTSILPAGLIMPGYPDVASLAAILQKSAISVAQAEFVRQIGASQLYASMKPNVIPLHSLVRDELIGRRLSRSQVVERMVRAVHERSIRILLLRPYDIYATSRLEPFLDDVSKISSSLIGRGYSIGIPKHLPPLGSGLLGAVSVASLFVVCSWSYLRRIQKRLLRGVSRREVTVLMLASLLLGVAMWKVPIVHRLAGGLTAAMVATEASLWALSGFKRAFPGLFAGIVIVLAGGLCIAAYYGTTAALLRLQPFSGVKMTLLLPPLLVLASDLKRGVHPETLPQIAGRPPLWGELMLCGILLIAALMMAVRSDNTAFVPGWEIRFRDALERALWVRPRTKEFLLGYPCLMLYYALVRRKLGAGWREVLRVGSTVAFSSAINSFCHFHTLLPLTLVRTANGWWLGIVVGMVLLVGLDYVVGLFWRGRTEAVH